MPFVPDPVPDVWHEPGFSVLLCPTVSLGNLGFDMRKPRSPGVVAGSDCGSSWGQTVFVVPPAHRAFFFDLNPAVPVLVPDGSNGGGLSGTPGPEFTAYSCASTGTARTLVFKKRPRLRP